MPRRFSEEDLARIKAAVQEAETRTSGEIVPYVVGACDDYDIATWKAACIGGMLATVVAFLIFHFYAGWGLGWLHTGWGAAAFIVGTALVFALIGTYVPAARRLLVGSDYLTARTHARAMRAFLEEEVFNTRDRTGILILVALFEHRIEVLGDSGINSRVSPDDWSLVVEHIREGILKDDLAAALVVAIEDCGELLEEKGVAVRKDDTDELSNRLRVSDR